MTIATIARRSGTSAPTTVPKTSRRMMSAAGRPKKSSPSLRSLFESSRKSRSAVNSPVIPVSKPPPPASRTTSITSSMFSSASGTHTDRQHGRVPVLRDEVRRGEMVLDVVRHAERLDVAAQIAHLRLEGRVLDRELRRVDDHELVHELLVRRYPLEQQLVGLVGLGVARDLAVRRQRRRQQRSDDADRHDERNHPHEHHAPRSSARDARERLDPASHARTLAGAPGAPQDWTASIW